MEKDKRIEEIKTRMYSIIRSNDIDDSIEAAKAYAMLCMAEQKESNETTTHNYSDGTRTGVFGNSDVSTYKYTE